MAEPPASIKWKLPSTTEYEIFESPFRIDALKFSDEGSYECLLDNGIWPPAKRQVKIKGKANSPPKISKPSVRRIDLSEGDDIHLNCHCEMCKPLHMLMWNHENNKKENHFHDSPDIKDDPKANIIDYSWNIKNVSLENGGIYTCIMNVKKIP